MPIGHFYKWEDSNHGLEHKCGTCKTVLSSPRAKKTCLGIHEEVCTRYHKTLFFLGQSHHCDACHNTDELHDKRHREIIKLIRSIRNLDGLASGASPFSSRKSKTHRSNLSLRKGTSDRREELADEELEQRNEPLGDQSVALDHTEDLEEWSLEEWNDSSTLDEDETGQRRRNQVDVTFTPGNRKAAKVERKRAKNQADVEVITDKDLQELYHALHPGQSLILEQKRQDASQGLAQNEAIENNITFNTRTFQYCSMRRNVHDKKMMRARLHRKELQNSPKQKKALIDPVLQNLGLNSNFTCATKQRKALDFKLREAMHDDIVAITNEQTETMQRMAGYWRYASRRTYNAMVRMNEIWDWATGAKLPEIDEEADLSDVAESESDGTVAGSVGQLPLNTGPPSTQVETSEDAFDISEDARTNKLVETSEANILKPIFDSAKTTTHPRVLLEGDHLIYSDGSSTESLTYHPGRSPGPTLTFAIPSPSSSDDFWNGPNISLEGNGEKSILIQPTDRNYFFKPSSMWTTKKTNYKPAEEGANGFKDKANHLSCPTKSSPALSENTKATNQELTISALPMSTAKDSLVAKDSNNRFKGLKIETTAPQETVGLVAPANARYLPTNKPYPNSSSVAKADKNQNQDQYQDSFPALPPTAIKLPKATTISSSVSKAKVLKISIAAVKLYEAKNKQPSRNKKFRSKAISLAVTPAESDDVDGTGTGEAAWTTVVKGKRR